jgi:hypothetical protein
MVAQKKIQGHLGKIPGHQLRAAINWLVAAKHPWRQCFLVLLYQTIFKQAFADYSQLKGGMAPAIAFTFLTRNAFLLNLLKGLCHPFDCSDFIH